MLSELIHPIHFFVAVGPLAVYLLVLGVINLSSRPFITTGARDAAALGVGVGGFVIIGPVYLLLPSETMFFFGTFVWLMLLALYVLVMSLFVLLLRPRLVIYNLPAERVRPMLATLVTQLDDQARWAGGCLVLPQLGVQLHVESAPSMRNVQLVSVGAEQSYEGWQRLHRALVEALRETRGVRNPVGFSLLFFGLVAIGLVTVWFAQDPETVAQTVQDMLGLTNE
jgi:uncharacterized membrane protein